MAECGTYAGYRAHLDYREPACDLCMEAQREYNRSRREAIRAGRLVEPRSTAPCGTVRAAWVHKEHEGNGPRRVGQYAGVILGRGQTGADDKRRPTKAERRMHVSPANVTARNDKEQAQCSAAHCLATVGLPPGFCGIAE